MINNKSDLEVKRNIALTRAQFLDLFRSLPSLQEDYKDEKNAGTALYIYLMKMRTALPSEDIGIAFGISQPTTDRAIKKARAALEKDFLYENVNYERTHQDMVDHTTTMCRLLFSRNNLDTAVTIYDGTYIFTNKSRNYEFQRLTYTDQKKRNFLKMMMCVSSDGTIIFALGPYSSHDNDAKVLKMIAESTTALDNLCEGDVLILDRGFRDCVKFFADKGFEVKMPGLLQKSQNKKQLSTKEANESRLVTATRFVVETINGHLKTIWKIFNRDLNPLIVPYITTDFQICAALKNKFFCTFEPNKSIAPEIANRMVDRVTKPNELSKIVLSDRFNSSLKKFTPFHEWNELPHLSYLNLLYISLGKYQIKQAESYCQEHIKHNDSTFIVFAFPEELCLSFFEELFIEGKSPILLLAQINSRFRSRKTYNAFVLIDRNGNAENAVLSYCCECYVGLRTVGCCSHVMTILWFTLHKKNRGIPKPASFLDNFFNVNEESETELAFEENAEPGNI